MWTFRRHPNLNHYQHKLDYFKSLCVNLMLTIMQKPIVDTQKIKIKESKHTTIENYEITKEESKGRRMEQRKYIQQTINKIEISTYLSVITFKVSGLNSPIKKHRVAEEIEKHGLSVCFPQETHHRYKDERWYFVQI